MVRYHLPVLNQKIMADKICFICGEPLTEENKSKEHILLNAAGGKLKSCDIMCNVCNRRLGSQPDEELALQLRPMVNFLGVKRDNGSTPNVPLQSADGKKYEMRDGGKPELAEAYIDFNPSTGDMLIEARNLGQARAALWKFKKEHPEYNIDVEEILKHFTNKREYIDEQLLFNVNWGGDEAFRSILKTALDFFILQGHDRHHIVHLLDYLLGNEQKDIVKTYYPDQPPYEYVEGEVLNLIHIVGDKSTSTLFAYVVYLGCLPAVILLSDHYDGEDFTDTYAHDVMSHQVIDKEVRLDMTLERFYNYQPYKGNYYKNASKAHGFTVRAGMGKQGEDELKDIVEYSFRDLPEGAEIDAETVQKLKENIMKYVVHQLHIQ